MIHDPATHCLGKLAPRHDPRTLRLASYISANVLPAVPASCDWTKGIPSWSVDGNKDYGDCTAAGAEHLFRLWNAQCGRDVEIPLSEVLALYSAVTKIEGAEFNPVTGANDNGCVELDVLKYLRTNGLGGHKIEAFASVEPSRTDLIKAAIWLFGGVYIGVALPITAQNQVIWDAPAGDPTKDEMPGSWGGHCLAPGTRVLTADLKWVPIETLAIGDELIGFDEHNTTINRRFYRRSVVEATAIIDLPCYDLEFSDGTRVTASEDHMWLVDNGRTTEWRRTDKLQMRKSRSTKILKAMTPWERDYSWDAGYLAAAFDGEGWIDDEKSRHIHKLGFAQRPNAMLSHVLQCLEGRGFKYWTDLRVGHGYSKGEVAHLQMGGREQLFRFLGSIRPRRLLSKFNPDRLGTMLCSRVTLAKRIPVGRRPVVAMRTSSRTFLAEGLASHNCVVVPQFDADGLTCITWGAKKRLTWNWLADYCDEVWALLAPDWIGTNSLSPASFNLVQLQADLAVITKGS